MRKININKLSEKVIYLIFWILVFVFPIILSAGGHGIDWVRVLNEWTRIFPFFLIFLFNNFLLLSLLKNKKYFSYIVYTTVTIFCFSFLSSFDFLFYDLINIQRPPRLSSKIDVPWILNNFFYNVIFSILVIGLNNAIKISIDWLQERRYYEQLQKENLQNQLSILQHQISPHFFMNTLNNIHALIDYDQEIAKKSVVKLSQLMRVLLYEIEADNFTLQKEINFLNDYIELMRIRVNTDVDIKFEYPEKVPECKLPPLLFINLVENAFKHGIKAIGKSFIHIYFTIEKSYLSVKISNSKTLISQVMPNEKNIGLHNSQKRLDLIYTNRHEFSISDTETTYEVYIRIPIQ